MKRQKWEYCYYAFYEGPQYSGIGQEWITRSSIVFVDPEAGDDKGIECKSVEDALSILGREGWELVSVLPRSAAARGPIAAYPQREGIWGIEAQGLTFHFAYMLIFKRPHEGRRRKTGETKSVTFMPPVG